MKSRKTISGNDFSTGFIHVYISDLSLVSMLLPNEKKISLSFAVKILVS